MTSNRRAARMLARELKRGHKAKDLVRIGESGISVTKENHDKLMALAAGVAKAALEGTAKLLREGKQATVLAAHAIRNIDANVENMPGRKLWACKTGCAHCCHHAVQITPPEAFLMANAINDSLPDEPRAELIALIAERAAAIRETGGDGSEHMRQRIPCAFLNDSDNACGAYDVRPIVCRVYTSFDANACKRQLEGSKEGIPQDQGMILGLGAVSAGMREAILQAHLDGDMYELHAAVLRALETENGEARWAAGERIFEGCK